MCVYACVRIYICVCVCVSDTAYSLPLLLLPAPFSYEQHQSLIAKSQLVRAPQLQLACIALVELLSGAGFLGVLVLVLVLVLKLSLISFACCNLSCEWLTEHRQRTSVAPRFAGWRW